MKREWLPVDLPILCCDCYGYFSLCHKTLAPWQWRLGCLFISLPVNGISPSTRFHKDW